MVAVCRDVIAWAGGVVPVHRIVVRKNASARRSVADVRGGHSLHDVVFDEAVRGRERFRTIRTSPASRHSQVIVYKADVSSVLYPELALTSAVRRAHALNPRVLRIENVNPATSRTASEVYRQILNTVV